MKALLITLVKAYRLLLSPWLGNSCRFLPSCSAYSLQALAQHGAFVGSCMTISRIARCQPWCQGGHDPVPAQAPKLFSRLLASSGSSPSLPTSEKHPS